MVCDLSSEGRKEQLNLRNLRMKDTDQQSADGQLDFAE
jgi:hypothetical protein